MLEDLKNRLPRVTYFDNMDGLAKQTFIMHALFTFKSIIMVSLVMYFWPNMVPVRIFEFWKMQGSLLDWLDAGKWILVWGAVVTVAWCIWTHNEPRNNRHAERILGQGIKLSIAGGIGQEILFRWGYLLAGIIGVQVFDWVLGGFFFDKGLIQTAYAYVTAPLADLTTLGHLSWLFTDPQGWMIGAAVLGTNLAYRDGHKYTGKFGVVNNWFVGMAFFYIMFSFGLLAAITVHVLYDLIIIAIVYGDMFLERARGRG